MLKNPDIILLDEPTSALDSENEKQVTEALNNLFQGKTVIIIAHRLQTVKHADEIIYIGIQRGQEGEKDTKGAKETKREKGVNGENEAKEEFGTSEVLERGTHTELLAL